MHCIESSRNFCPVPSAISTNWMERISHLRQFNTICSSLQEWSSNVSLVLETQSHAPAGSWGGQAQPETSRIEPTHDQDPLVKVRMNEGRGNTEVVFRSQFTLEHVTAGAIPLCLASLTHGLPDCSVLTKSLLSEES